MRLKVSPQATEMKTILLVAEQDRHRIVVKWLLGNFGFSVESTGTAHDALALFDAKIHALVITESSLPGVSGTEMAQIIKLRSPRTPVVLCSEQLPQDRGCVDVILLKPFHLLVLKEVVEYMLEGGPWLFKRIIPACRSSACRRGPFRAAS